MTVQEFLEEHNLSYKPRGDQYVVDECPLCGKEWHFYIHQEAGLWHCKACGEFGNLWTLRRQLKEIDDVTSVSDLLALEKAEAVGVNEAVIEEYGKVLLEDSFTIDWLLSRGIARASIKRCKLGLCKEGMNSWLTIPYYQGGKPVNMKFRSLPPAEKTFRVLPDHPTPLYSPAGQLPVKGESVFVTEGELDAIVLAQQGYVNTVSVPMGAGTFLPEHFDALVRCGKVYLIFDSDPAGMKGMKDVASRLGPERCFIVRLPVNDISDFFAGFSRADFEGVLSEAVTAGKPTVLSMASAFQELEETRSRRKEETLQVGFPWRSVDKIVGALRPGWLVVLQSVPFTGKSTFALNTLEALALKGIPGLMFCLEMTPVQLLERLIASFRGVKVSAISDTDIVMAKAELYKTPLYFGRSTSADLRPERVYETVRYSVQRFGVKLVVIDHLHFLCRSVSHITQEVGNVVRSLKLLFEELQIPGILITHPPKIPENEAPGLYGARDSGEIAGDADLLMSLYRRQMSRGAIKDDDFVTRVRPTFESRTLVTVPGSRYCAGGTAVLFFDGDCMRFEEAVD